MKINSFLAKRTLKVCCCLQSAVITLSPKVYTQSKNIEETKLKSPQLIPINKTIGYNKILCCVF